RLKPAQVLLETGLTRERRLLFESILRQINYPARSEANPLTVPPAVGLHIRPLLAWYDLRLNLIHQSVEMQEMRAPLLVFERRPHLHFDLHPLPRPPDISDYWTT